MSMLNLRTRLAFGAFLIACLSLGIATVLIPLRVERTFESLAETKLRLVSRSISAMAEELLKQHVETLKVISVSGSVQSWVRKGNRGVLNEREVRAFKYQLTQYIESFGQDHQGVFVISENGSIIAGALQNGDSSAYDGLNVRDREYFQRVKRTLAPVVSDPLISKVGGVPIVVVALPLVDESGFWGMIGVSIHSDRFLAIMKSQSFGRGGGVMAFDSKGHRLRVDGLEETGAAELSEILGPDAKKIGANLPSTVVAYTQGAERRVAVFEPIPHFGWIIVASQPEQEFKAELWRTRGFMLFLVFVCTTIAAASAYLLARRLTDPLRDLAVVLGIASENVASGSRMIAQGASGLAEEMGAQAASVEQTNHALSDLTSTIKGNSVRSSAVAAIASSSEFRLTSAHRLLEQELVSLRMANARLIGIDGRDPFRQLENCAENIEAACDDSKRVRTLVAEIATATKEQTASAENIKTALVNYEAGTKSAAALAQLAAAAAVELDAQVTTLGEQRKALNRLITGS